MITGYNTDVDHEGRTYHVQTEDRGRNFPVVESLVYCGGEIVASRRRPYGDLLERGDFSDAQVQGLMDEQHQRLAREIQNGKFDTDKLKPFGYDIVTNRSFDAVVLDYLEQNLTLEQIQLKMTGPRTLRPGANAMLRLEVIERNTARPICGANVAVHLVDAPGAEPQELFAAFTDEQGRVDAAFKLPQSALGEAILLCHAEAASRVAEIKRPLNARKPEAPPALTRR